jgi:hypothetical protein
MTSADNSGLDPNAAPAAGEHMIPKHRLDETLERLREAERSLRTKDELLNRLAPQQQAPVAQEPNFEEMGLDPTVGRAMMHLINKVTDTKLGGAKKQIQGMIGMAAQRSDEALFLAQHGSDKSKYLDKVRDYRESHYQKTGQALDVDTAYKLIVFDELTAKTRAVQPQGQPAAQAPAAVAQAAPPAAGTTQSAPPGAGGEKGFDEMTIEEQEVYLNQNMAQGHTF